MALESGTRRQFLVAAAALPAVGAAPFVIDRLRSPAARTEVGAGVDQELRITSNNGRFEAWADPLPDGASIYAPGPRTRSTIAVRNGSSSCSTASSKARPTASRSDDSASIGFAVASSRWRLSCSLRALARTKLRSVIAR